MREIENLSVAFKYIFLLFISKCRFKISFSFLSSSRVKITSFCFLKNKENIVCRKLRKNLNIVDCNEINRIW